MTTAKSKQFENWRKYECFPFMMSPLETILMPASKIKMEVDP